jgi:hypothetical protein
MYELYDKNSFHGILIVLYHKYALTYKKAVWLLGERRKIVGKCGKAIGRIGEISGNKKGPACGPDKYLNVCLLHQLNKIIKEVTAIVRARR